MSTRKKIYKKKGNVVKDLTQKIFKVLNQAPNKSFNYKQIASKLELKDANGRNQLIQKLEESSVEIKEYAIIPDEIEAIQKAVLKHAAEKTDMILFTGGTGLSKRDVTPEALKPILDREIPGIAEAARSYGQDRTPYAMLSRSVAGVKDQTLVLALPGSTKGAAESMDALFPAVLHVFRIFKGARHD